MSRYYVLQISDAIGTKPRVSLHTCKSDTHREELAIKIFNNRDEELVCINGRFDEKKDLLLPITLDSERFRFLDLKSFNRQDLEDEDSDDENEGEDDRSSSSYSMPVEVAERFNNLRRRRR